MHKLAICTVLSLAASVSAQGFTMPPGFTTLHNTNLHPLPYSFELGSYTEQRFQVINGDLTGKGARTLTSLSLRRDSEYYYPDWSQGHARSWSNVDIRVGDSDHANASRTFSLNLVGTPTLVFSGKTNWLDTRAQPTGKETWGGFNMGFPFQQTHLWTAQKDLCTEFAFSGGVIANNASSSFVMLDGVSDGDRGGPLWDLLGDPRCKQAPASPFVLFHTEIYTYAPPNQYGNKHKLIHHQGNSAASTNHIALLALGGVEAGVQVGTCEKLYVSPSQALAYLHYATTPYGEWATEYFVPYSATAVGLVIWSQAAYTDPRSNAFSLTAANRCTVPPMPVIGRYKHTAIKTSSTNATTGSMNTFFVPILKFN